MALAAGPAKVNHHHHHRHHHHHPRTDHCVNNPKAALCAMTHEANDNDIHPRQSKERTLCPPIHPATRTPTATRGRLPSCTHHVPATLNPPPFTPNCFERTHFPLLVLRGYPFRCERSRGDSLFLGKQAQPYVTGPAIHPCHPAPPVDGPDLCEDRSSDCLYGEQDHERLQVFAQNVFR